MEMLISFSNMAWHLPTLPKVPIPHLMTMGLLCLTGQHIHLNLNSIENSWGIVKRKMRDTRPNNADELDATIETTWAP